MARALKPYTHMAPPGLCAQPFWRKEIGVFGKAEPTPKPPSVCLKVSLRCLRLNTFPVSALPVLLESGTVSRHSEVRPSCYYAIAPA